MDNEIKLKVARNGEKTSVPGFLSDDASPVMDLKSSSRKPQQIPVYRAFSTIMNCPAGHELAMP